MSKPNISLIENTSVATSSKLPSPSLILWTIFIVLFFAAACDYPSWRVNRALRSFKKPSNGFRKNLEITPFLIPFIPFAVVYLIIRATWDLFRLSVLIFLNFCETSGLAFGKRIISLAVYWTPKFIAVLKKFWNDNAWPALKLFWQTRVVPTLIKWVEDLARSLLRTYVALEEMSNKTIKATLKWWEEIGRQAVKRYFDLAIIHILVPSLKFLQASWQILLIVWEHSVSIGTILMQHIKIHSVKIWSLTELICIHVLWPALKIIYRSFLAIYSFVKPHFPILARHIWCLLTHPLILKTFHSIYRIITSQPVLLFLKTTVYRLAGVVTNELHTDLLCGRYVFSTLLHIIGFILRNSVAAWNFFHVRILPILSPLIMALDWIYIHVIRPSAVASYRTIITLASYTFIIANSIFAFTYPPVYALFTFLYAHLPGIPRVLSSIYDTLVTTYAPPVVAAFEVTTARLTNVLNNTWSMMAESIYVMEEWMRKEVGPMPVIVQSMIVQ